jgi:hypothetical protein
MKRLALLIAGGALVVLSACAPFKGDDYCVVNLCCPAGQHPIDAGPPGPGGDICVPG